MTLRLPPTSACAAAARRPSPVPRARVRRCPALIARSRRRCPDWQGSAGGLALDGGWPYAVCCRAWLLRGCLLCGGLTFTGGLAHSWSSAGRTGRRRSCCSTAQGAQRSAGQVLACPRRSSSAGRSGAWLLMWTASGHRYCAYSRDALPLGCCHSAQAAELGRGSRSSRRSRSGTRRRARRATHGLTRSASTSLK